MLSASTLAQILGRDQSFLAEEIVSQTPLITSSLKGARVLIIGAAGSIGCSFVKELTAFQVAGLHLVDISENNLAEVVRDLRSSGIALPEDFCTYSIDFGNAEMHSLLRSQAYDFVLNFSALKHVRSERDPFTLMRLLDVNVLANARLLDALERVHRPERIFAVSSDKAVRSANVMGGSKALMERVFLDRTDTFSFGSARFANVAFSDGSLLHAFRQRIDKGQPITAPSDVRRYFISHKEAGQLCLLGCFAGANREIVFPNFKPDEDMKTFSEIAELFLHGSGYEPIHCSSEEEALEKAAGLTDRSREWPCYFSESDTAGEKMFEEFVDPSEIVDLDRFPNVGVVTSPAFSSSEVIAAALKALNKFREKGSWSHDDLLETVTRAIPEMQHVKADKNLDQKM